MAALTKPYFSSNLQTKHRTMTNSIYVDERNTRGNHQNSIYKSIVDAGEDPFKKENLMKYHNGEILFENSSWFVIQNQWPYPRTKHHLVIILQRFIAEEEYLTLIELQDLQEIKVRAKRVLGFKGGTFIMRSGDTLFTGATVTHLHGHLIVADVDHPDYGPENRVKVVLGGNKTKPETT